TATTFDTSCPPTKLKRAWVGKLNTTSIVPCRQPSIGIWRIRTGCAKLSIKYAVLAGRPVESVRNSLSSITFRKYGGIRQKPQRHGAAKPQPIDFADWKTVCRESLFLCERVPRSGG